MSPDTVGDKTRSGASVVELPLIRDFGAGAAFAYRGGAPIAVERFLRDVLQLQSRLPAASHVLNLCADRYHFSVGFAASLLRRQVSLLPPNQTPDLFERLSRQYPDAYCLVDSEVGHSPFATMLFPSLPETHGPAPVIPVVPAAQLAALLLTSGSTGQPTPHEKSWGALVHSALAELSHLSKASAGTAILGTVPPQHMYGLESTVLMAMQGGLALDAARPFYPADVSAALAALPRPRALVTTPVHLRALVAESAGLPQADFLVCATAPLSPQLAAAAEVRFAAPLYEVYGCTEAGQIATRRTVETSEWRALPGIALRQNEQGTWVRGGHVDGEVLLSDVIELCGGDRFLLHGRKADLVNIAGKRTSLAHLNYHLNSIEGVRDGVFIVPPDQGDAATVTRLMAFVVAPGITSEAVMEGLRRRLDTAFLPRPLCFVESLPRTATSKLPRDALAALASELATKAG